MKKIMIFCLIMSLFCSQIIFAETSSNLPYVIEPQYYSAWEFNRYGIAQVQLEPEFEGSVGVLGVINLKGERVFGFDGTKFAIRKNGLIMAVGDNDKAAFFSSEGKQLTDYIYETFKREQPKTPHFVTYHYVNDYYDGDGKSDLVPICRDGKFGFINSKGEETIEPKFDYVFGFIEGISKIGYDGELSEYGTYTNCKFGYVNEKGEVLPTGKLWEAGDFSHGYARIADGQYKVIDKNGNEVDFPTGAYNFVETNGNFIIASDTGGLVVLDMNGKLLSGTETGHKALFGKSFIIGQKQIADINGNIIYEAPEGVRIDYFGKDGPVTKISKRITDQRGLSIQVDGLINQQGEVIIEPGYKGLREVAEGVFWTPDSKSLFDVYGNSIAEVEGYDVSVYNTLTYKLLPVKSYESHKWGYVELPKVSNPFISKYTESDIYEVYDIWNTEYGAVLYLQLVGAPHATGPSLILVREDGESISLSAVVARKTPWAHPEHKDIKLSEDGRYITFNVSFEERSAGNMVGPETYVVLHDAGTYYYKADLKLGKTVETRFEPLDIMGEDMISAWAKPEVSKAIELGFVPITLRDSYKRNITRSEFAKMAVFFLSVQYGYQPEHIIRTYYNTDKEFPLEDFISAYCSVKKDRNGNCFMNSTTSEAWKYEDKKAVDPVGEMSLADFTDLTDKNIFDNRLIGVAYNFGIVNGISQTAFNPEGNITRQEAAAMLMRVYKNYAEYQNADTEFMFIDDSDISEWAKEDVYNINALGVMQGVGENSFAPLEGYTVEQAIATFLRLYESAPVSRKNKNIEPLLDFEYEKANFFIENPGNSKFLPENEYELDEYTVVSGTYQRLHRSPDHKLYVFCKYGGKRDLTSFVPVAYDNKSPIEDITIKEDENIITFVTEVSDSFCLFNKLNGTEKVYGIGKYRFEVNMETGNIIGIECLG